ncbi:MAG: hypothetical protein AAF849_10800 [Bacteroidota bacterium]
MRYLFLLNVLLLFAQCDQAKKTDQAEQVEEQTKQNEQTLITTETLEKMPSIPRAKMDQLWESCKSIDYIMTNLPFSISTSDQQQSRGLLRHIGVAPSAYYQNCSKTATISYVGDSGILAEADLYFSQSDDRCNFFVFYEDGQPKYANRFTQEAYDYYKQIFDQVQVTNGN